jgi:hypothetical protein
MAIERIRQLRAEWENARKAVVAARQSGGDRNAVEQGVATAARQERMALRALLDALNAEIDGMLQLEEGQRRSVERREAAACRDRRRFDLTIGRLHAWLAVTTEPRIAAPPAGPSADSPAEREVR